MASVSVIYQTRSHHTETVAKAIADEIGTEPIDISVPHTLPETDLLFIGMGIYGGKPDYPLLDYLDQLPVNRIKGAALFSTCASGNDRTELAARLLEHKGITVYPRRFICRGRFLVFAKGHPDDEDCENAAAFARTVMNAFNG